MKYLRSPAGEVYAFALDGSEDAFIPSGLVGMTAAEVELHINPVRQPTVADIDAERDRRMAAGVEFKDSLFQSRPSDHENIIGAAQLAFTAVASGARPGNLRWSDPNQDFTWIAADNSLVPMDAPTVVDLGNVVIARKQALIHAGRQLKDMETIPSDYVDDKWWP
ncbi:DUF4376 domain-containing protein [Pseudomonas solani]|uniref:DUF4376 domain-containing protein n=1 Tax=Pseudomonas solani TaxID=2731552 RepID=UPI003C2EAA54